MSPSLDPHTRAHPDSAMPNSDPKLGSPRSNRKSGAPRKAPTRGGGGGGGRSAAAAPAAAAGGGAAEGKTPEASPSDAVPASRRGDDSQAHPDSEKPVKLDNSSTSFDSSADTLATDEHDRHCEDMERNEGLESFSAYCWDHFTAFYHQQKPHIDAFSAAMLDWRHKIQSLMRRAWPPLRSGLLIVGGIALTVGLMWLDSCIRGFKSLFRLGSAALFLLVCCTALNLGILAGFSKLVVALALSLGTAFLLGYTPALAVIGTFSAVVLWLYGSFWFTGGMVLIGGSLFIADQPRLAMLVELLYSTYTARKNGGWLGLFLCLNFSFIFSNLMIFFLHSSTSETGGQGIGGTSGPSFGKDKTRSSGNPSGASHATVSPDGFQASESTWTAEGASTSGVMEGELNFVDREVERLLGCKDHYAVLGLDRYAEIDLAILKRDYRKKAMLVHPDKNLGNEVAEEAFKRLQNAYEVLLDPLKKRSYDEELKREEVLLTLKRFQQEVLRNGRSGTVEDRCTHSEDEGDDELSADSRRIPCKKCSKMHLWICTDRNKLHARWCQECQDYHQAKDGDGWVEQSVHALLFGIFQRVEAPRAYACADSKIYEVTEWVQCRGMKCPPNTHKPTFHVSTAGIAKGQARGTRASKATFNNTAEGFSFAHLNETMTEEEFIKWLENAMASGMFNDMNEVPAQPEAKGGNRAKSSRKKRKGKNKW